MSNVGSGDRRRIVIGVGKDGFHCNEFRRLLEGKADVATLHNLGNHAHFNFAHFRPSQRYVVALLTKGRAPGWVRAELLQRIEDEDRCGGERVRLGRQGTLGTSQGA